MQEVLLLLLVPLCSGGGRLHGASKMVEVVQQKQVMVDNKKVFGSITNTKEILVCLLQASQRSQIICKFVVQINYVSDCLNLDKYMEFSKSIIGICLSVWPWPYTRTACTGWTVIQKYMLFNKESLFQNYIDATSTETDFSDEVSRDLFKIIVSGLPLLSICSS